MRQLVWGCALFAACGACYRNPAPIDANAKTVIEVDNQAFDDVNVFVLPEGGPEVRLGLATGKHQSYFDLPPRVLLPGIRSLRFVARPIASRRGPVTNDINVLPGDTVIVMIPPV